MLQTWCFVGNEELKRDSKKANDERKKYKLTRKN